MDSANGGARGAILAGPFSKESTAEEIFRSMDPETLKALVVEKSADGSEWILRAIPKDGGAKREKKRLFARPGFLGFDSTTTMHARKPRGLGRFCFRYLNPAGADPLGAVYFTVTMMCYAAGAVAAGFLLRFGSPDYKFFYAGMALIVSQWLVSMADAVLKYLGRALKPEEVRAPNTCAVPSEGRAHQARSEGQKDL